MLRPSTGPRRTTASFDVEGLRALTDRDAPTARPLPQIFVDDAQLFYLFDNPLARFPLAGRFRAVIGTIRYRAEQTVCFSVNGAPQIGQDLPPYFLPREP